MTLPGNSPDTAMLPEARRDTAKLSEGPIAPSAEGRVDDDAGNVRRYAIIATSVFFAVFVVCMLGYVAIAVPGQWFPGASTRTWNVKDLNLTRGSGHIAGDEMIVTAPDANGM